jgi:hypothetical protein
LKFEKLTSGVNNDLAVSKTQFSRHLAMSTALSGHVSAVSTAIENGDFATVRKNILGYESVFQKLCSMKKLRVRNSDTRKSRETIPLLKLFCERYCTTIYPKPFYFCCKFGRIRHIELLFFKTMN